MRGEVEIVVNRGRYLAELRTVDRLAVGEAQLLQAVDVERRVERREDVVAAVETALPALDIVARVRDQLHAVVLVAYAGINIPPPERHDGRDVARTEKVVALVVVAHALLFDEIQLVVAEILLVRQQLRHVHRAEVGGQVVLFHVPAVDKLARRVFAAAVFAVGSHLQVHETEGVAVADINRCDVLAEFRELTVDLVAGSEHHRATLKSVVDGVAPAVGHQPVGKRVAAAPFYLVVVEGVLACQLRVGGQTAAVVVFCTRLVV